AEKDNESEAERLKREEKELKEREERENKDREKDRAAKDEEDKKEKEKMANDSRLAMDAAVKGVEARFVALRQAERDVRPVVGELACDSAEEVYRTALKQMGCEDHATIPVSGLRSVFNAYAKVPTMAQDSAPIAASSRDAVRNFFEGK
ncbi:phage protein, partial [Morganella morganii]